MVEVPREESYGDFSTNAAMLLARKEKKSPKILAQILIENMEQYLNSTDNEPLRSIKKIELAGPGFINFFIEEEFWLHRLLEIWRQGDSFGSSDLGKGKRVHLEFVSANPTGPLHIGHGRIAAIGDALANILKMSGFEVYKEYYINDLGNQIDLLAKSVLLRYRERLGERIDYPPEYYQGDYIKDIAQSLNIQHQDAELEMSKLEQIVRDFSLGYIIRMIKEDLHLFGVKFDGWFSEKKLLDRGMIKEAIERLKEEGKVYEENKALWFKSTLFGDEKDRVLIKTDGNPTYFASDIAYHKDKYQRGYDQIINIWGSDHHGYVPRMKGVIRALGREESSFRVILVQLVNLLSGGKPVTMSTRAGEFATLREVIEEVGRDAARFFLLMRNSDSPLDFDLELAKKQSMENPVYYVQYAHARICSIFRVAEEKGLDVHCLMLSINPETLKLLNDPEEIKLAKLLASFPDVVKDCSLSLEPHRISFYLQDIAALFHRYYNRCRVIGEDKELSKARLLFAKATGIVLKNALHLLGVSAPEKM